MWARVNTLQNVWPVSISTVQSVVFLNTHRSGVPIYEIPKGVYSAEQILAILLNDKIDPQRICHQRPTCIERSSTFIVDLDSLKHPDDVMNLANGLTVVHTFNHMFVGVK